MGGVLTHYTRLNSESDFYYRYARYTFYCDVTNEGEIDINHITRGPFEERIGIQDISVFVRQKIINDLTKRIKSVGRKDSKCLRGLQIEIRKSL